MNSLSCGDCNEKRVPQTGPFFPLTGAFLVFPICWIKPGKEILIIKVVLGGRSGKYGAEIPAGHYLGA